MAALNGRWTMLSMLRLPGARARYGKGRSSYYNDIRAGLMTPPVPLGARAVGWPQHELEAIIAARVAGKSDDEIRELVKRLIAERKTALERLEAQI
jgi:prophage regulatory protein